MPAGSIRTGIYNDSYSYYSKRVGSRLNTTLNEIGIVDEIESSLKRYEPRISDIVATATIRPDSNEVNVTVQYTIVGIPAPTQEVDVILFPARV